MLNGKLFNEVKNYRKFFTKKDDSYANDLLDRFLFSARFFKALWIEVSISEKGLKKNETLVDIEYM